MNYSKLLLCVAIFAFISCDKTNPEKLDSDIGPGKDLVLTAIEQQKTNEDNLFAFQLFHTATVGLQAHENALLSPTPTTKSC